MNRLATIQSITEDLLSLMTFSGSVQVREREGVVEIDITLQDPAVLIGFKGETLASLQHLVRVIVTRKVGEPLRVLVDINGYRKKRLLSLKELARTTADQVRFSKQAVGLDPMSAFERRIIHVELAVRPDVVTESVGQDPERRVMVKPYP